MVYHLRMMPKAKLVFLLTLLGMVCGIAPVLSQNQEAQAYFDGGVKQYKAGQFKSAAPLFWKSINKGNATPQAWLYMAHSYNAAGNKYEAIKTYKQIAKIYKNTKAARVAQTAIRKLDPYNRWKEKQPKNSKSSSSYSSASQLPHRARVFYHSKGDDILLNVRINGRPLEMEFDTGAPGISLDKSHLRKLGIKPPTGKPAGYSGGATNSVKIPYWRMEASVQVGPIRRDNLRLKVYEKMHSIPLLGQAFYKDFDYTVDHKARCVEFRLKGSMNSSSGRGYSLPFEFRRSGNRVVVEIEINGRKGKAMLDTGNTADGISFDSKRQMAKFGINLPANAKLGRATGVSGSGSQYDFTLRRVKLGPIDKSNVSASCSIEIAPDDEELPLIGQEVLKGWQFSIDMSKKVIHFLRR